MAPADLTPAQRRLRRRRWVAFALLVVVLAGCVWYLIEARKPWDSRIVAKIEEGRRLGFADHVAVGLWWGTLANAVLALGLAATVPLWLTQGRLPHPPPPPARPMDPWRFHLPVLAAMAVSVLLGVPRLTLSLWGDEEHALRQNILGEWAHAPDGERETFHRLSWRHNLWMYEGPNNHFLFTLQARLLHDLRAFTAPPGALPYDEALLRLPAFVAGVAAIGALAAMMRHFGFGLGGLVSAWFLALHPWHLKYATEARGYSLVLFFAPLGLVFLSKALREGLWKWWVLHALCQFLLIYSYPGALFLPIAQNLCAVGALLFLQRDRAVRTQLLIRWLVSGVCAAMVAIQLLAPAVPQLLAYLARDRARGDLGWDWALNFTGHLVGGMAWIPWDPANPLCESIRGLAVTAPWKFWLLGALVPLVLGLGVWSWMRRGGVTALLGVALLTAAPLGFLQAKLSGNLLYVWYLIYALPAAAAFIGAAFDRPRPTKRPWLPRSGPASVLAALVFLFAYGVATSGQRGLLRTRPIEPQRESVLATRPSLDPNDPRNLHVLTAEIVFTVPTYDPRAVPVKDVDTLESLMRQADIEGRPLFVNFGGEGWARHVFPEVVARVQDPGRFERTARLYGLDAQNTRLVYRYRPGSLDSPAE